MDIASLRPLFAPDSVAVVGASNDENKVGGRPIAFLRKGGYSGRVVPINPRASQVQGYDAAPSLDAVSGSIEHAIVAVAAKDVLAAVRQCAERGVKALQVYSSGFADTGNLAGQQALLSLVRGAGMRLVGPNSLGLFNATNGFFGTFATALDGAWPASDPSGSNVGFATQSGAFGSYCYGLAQARGLKFSQFIATGNEADVDVAECIAWFAQDRTTRVIVATFEGCKDGGRLVEALRIAHEAGKPVLVMKVGSSLAGAEAAATHTGSLAGRDAVFDGVFRQFGAWRAHSLDQLIDTAYALCTGPAVSPLQDGRGGARLGIVTTSGGIGVLLADRSTDAGLDLPALDTAVAARLALTEPTAIASNPLDTSTAVLGDLSRVAACMEAAADGTQADTVLAFLGHIGRNPRHWAQLKEPLCALVARRPATRFVICMLAPPSVRQELDQAGILLFEEPTRAVEAIRALVEVRRALGREQAAAPPRPSEARGGLARTLNEAASKRELAAAGLAVPAEGLARSAAEAAAIARDLGSAHYALKIVSPDITHKSEVGGVLLDVAAANAAQAWTQLMDTVPRLAPGARLDGVLVTPMAGAGIDAILGLVQDPVFGPVVMFGLGGTWVEVFADVVFRTAPVSPQEALRMIEQTRVAALLAGIRGDAPVDRDQVAALIARFSRHAVTHVARLDSIEVNPLRLRPGEALALDAVVVERTAGSPSSTQETA